MFKNNNKDNNFKFIDAEDLDKAYKHQEKLFNSKIEEQQNQIDDLVNFISARFGEDYKKSDVNAKISNLEKSFQTIQDNYKSELDKSVKVLEEEVNKTNAGNLKVFHEYNELFAKNHKELNSLRDIISKKDEKIEELKEIIKKNSNEYQEYKKYITTEFDNTNKKIGKINYMGITSKFDKRLKEENGKLKNTIQDLNKELDEYVTITKQAMIEDQEGINKCSKEIESFNTTIANNNALQDSKIKENNEQLKVLDQKIEKMDKDNKQATSDAIDKMNNELKTEISHVEKQTNTRISELGNKILDDVDNVEKQINDKIKEIDDRTSNFINTLSSKFSEEKKANRFLFEKFEQNLSVKLKQGEDSLNQKIKSLEGSFNTKTKTTDESILNIKNYVNENYKNVNLCGKDIQNIKKVQNNLSIAYKGLVGNLSNQKEDLKTKITSVNDALNQYIEQATNSNNELNSRLANIDTLMNNYNKESAKIQAEYSKKMEELSKSILSLKNEAKDKSEVLKSGKDTVDIKKDYDSFVARINKQLETIQNEFAEAQKKNTENNKNLQLKIKTYVDKKVEIASSHKTNNLDEILDKINLSIAEKEKLQRKETEEFLHKKLKEIQKENDILLKKKIEELNREYGNETIVNNSNNVDFKQNVIKAKKKLFDVVDEGTMLKQTASSKEELKTKEGKSQILKFYYDDDDLN